ncbi:GNAT family N-acetyltransferase [Azospirillum argentinense]|uniref:GNAT family N-acetyltransferase n=2 Tax=Azospirillum TaxID=191 RepID=A0A4D8Q4I9_AZOBR|nr:GNAT family N-acetyltransferase [Azospirillum argentinense]QCN98202.1 GNAT family N-acetyltransferase [Azospirillum argentinense]QCO05195.1 GNAT family N-acetyltransferase [Azospirillum argentinense]
MTGLRFVPLTPDALGAVLALQREACGPLMHPLGEAELSDMLAGPAEGHGVVLGALTDHGLAAFLAVQFPGRTDHNLGRDYGLPEGDLDRALHFTGILVHPHRRGQGLHRRLIETAAQGVLPPDRHRYWFATVRPENTASVRGMLSVGMSVFARKPKHDGHDRLLFVRDLSAPAGG